MGRYLTPSGGGTGSGGGSARSERHVITANTPALPVPAWAKLARVSGVGGGAGGGNRATAGVRGAGGGSGGVARDVLLPINGAATVSVVIGGGGVGAAGSSNGNGTNGGNTVVTIGAQALTLFGGVEGSGAVSGSSEKGDARMGAPAHYADGEAQGSGAFHATGGIGLFYGFSGLRGDAETPGGAGAASPFGPGGAAVPYPVAANTVGANGIGYGSGGAGGHGTGKGGDGSPGLAIIEFLEAA